MSTNSFVFNAVPFDVCLEIIAVPATTVVGFDTAPDAADEDNNVTVVGSGDIEPRPSSDESDTVCTV